MNKIRQLLHAILIFFNEYAISLLERVITKQVFWKRSNKVPRCLTLKITCILLNPDYMIYLLEKTDFSLSQQVSVTNSFLFRDESFFFRQRVINPQLNKCAERDLGALSPKYNVFMDLFPFRLRRKQNHCKHQRQQMTPRKQPLTHTAKLIHV